MKIVFKLLKNEKTQVLNNVISITELGDIIQIKTTQEEFKVDKNKVEVSVFIENLNISNREKLMNELDEKIDKLLKLQQEGKITNGLEGVEEIKNYIKNYKDVSDKDKKELIDGIEMMEFEIFMKKILRGENK